MSVPLSFWLGFAVLALSGHLVQWLPGEATSGDLLLGAAFLPLPALWMRFAARRVRRGRRPGIRARLLLRLHGLSVPIAMGGLLMVGGYQDFVERTLPDLHILRFVGLLAPLLLLEMQLRFAIGRLARKVEYADADVDVPIDVTSGAMIALIVTAALLLGAGMDMLATWPALAAFVEVTDLGTTLGLIGAVLLGSWFLPLLFRLILPTSRDLPARVEQDLRAVASRLGFRARDLLSLDTGMRMVNAAMVGPLSWPRYLVLTDGILTYLDPQALRGVVAHEIGHARAGHPALLIVVFLLVPIALIQPLDQLDLHAIAPGWLILSGAVLAVLFLLGTRAMMHRFEFEADDLSAHALGGAEPCIVALTRVGELFPGHRFRSSFRHPSEVARVQALVARQHNADHREAFRRRGRVLRIGVVVIALAAAAVSTWAHMRTFEVDLASLALHGSRFDEAAERIAKIPPGVEPERVERLRSEIDAALVLLAQSKDRRATLADLAESAFDEAIRRAADSGPSTARPYFALALAVPRDDVVRTSAWMWSECSPIDEAARARRLAAHLLRLDGTPEALRKVMERQLATAHDGG
ncbi:MAG: M48 family metalloprotease [Planctomycetota bacterium]